MTFFYIIIKFLNIIRYRMKGVACDMTNSLSFRRVVILSGKSGGVILKKHAEIATECLLIAKNRIEIGENSTLAYRVTILTTANPNTPYNALGKIYPPISKPVIIGDNVWVGVCSVILSGISIGNGSVIAAGSVVTRNVPEHVLVAGVPAKIVKKLPPVC